MFLTSVLRRPFQKGANSEPGHSQVVIIKGSLTTSYSIKGSDGQRKGEVGRGGMPAPSKVFRACSIISTCPSCILDRIPAVVLYVPDGHCRVSDSTTSRHLSSAFGLTG